VFGNVDELKATGMGVSRGGVSPGPAGQLGMSGGLTAEANPGAIKKADSKGMNLKIDMS
jgi:hypothetical protein